MADPTVLIVNPRASMGRTGRRWRDLEALIRRVIPEFEVRQTEGPGHATILTREAIVQGASLVIAVGGDGTNNEVVNGFFTEDLRPLAGEASFAFISTGTGSDLGRSLNHSGPVRASALRIAKSPTRKLDVGRVAFVNHEGEEQTRIFINIASFGISGPVVQAVNRRTRGGRLAYSLATLRAILSYRNVPVEIAIDGGDPERLDLTLCAVANGRYFGGGMMIAPEAKLDDGAFDVVCLWGWRPAAFLASAPRVFSGSHLSLARVSLAPGRRVEARPVDGDTVLLDVDGEQPGRLPATFEIMPAALGVRC